MSLADDAWIEKFSPIEAKKLHALGVITFMWNACEYKLFELFHLTFGITPQLVLAPGRGVRHVARARQVAMYLAHVDYGLDFAAVGRAFHRDRTTVAHACQVVEDRRDNAWFDRRVTALERICRNRIPFASAEGDCR